MFFALASRYHCCLHRTCAHTHTSNIKRTLVYGYVRAHIEIKLFTTVINLFGANIPNPLHCSSSSWIFVEIAHFEIRFVFRIFFNFFFRRLMWIFILQYSNRSIEGWMSLFVSLLFFQFQLWLLDFPSGLIPIFQLSAGDNEMC